MHKPIFYYTEENKCGHQHCDQYHLGPCHCHHNNGCSCCPPVNPNVNYHGSVSVVAKAVLTIKYVDKHGHYQTFDIKDGETYEITAVSSTKGICTFAGRVVDFECNTGIEKVLAKPHEVNVTSLIVDYSDAYESKLIRLYVNNIIGIKPIRVFDGDMNYPTTQCNCSCSNESEQLQCHVEPIQDPFA